MRRRKIRTLPPVHPNAGIEAEYRARLDALIREMNKSVRYWLEASYRANQPYMAQDALPADALRRIVRKLARRWQKRFDEAAERLAEYFTVAAASRSQRRLMKILKDAGFSVRFRMTRPMQDAMAAAINEQVSLIKSIPARYFAEIEGQVMRSVGSGRDLGTLSRFLETQYGVTRRRAALIARDQNNKATATLTRVRQKELGIHEAIWVHSGGGKEPRPTHLAAGNRKQRYDVNKGWYDPDAHGKGQGAYILPGELINCRCVSRPVIPGL